MATAGTPFEGLDYIGAKIYISSALTLIGYTNTADSLGPSTVYADLAQPTTSNGYAAITLDGTWSFTDGIVTYVHSTPTHPTWTATGAWSAPVVGAAIVDVVNTTVLHFKDLSATFNAAAGKKLAIDIDTVVA